MEVQKEQGAIDRLLQDDVIDLRQYWQTIMRHKWGIIGFSFVVTLLTILVVYSLTPIYRATATLLIESQQANVVSIEEVYGIEGGQSEYYTTQFEILKSRRLAEKVVNRLGLVDHPEFNKVEESFLPFSVADIKASIKALIPVELPGADVQGEDDPFNDVVEAFMGMVSIEPVRKSQLVKLVLNLPTLN